MKTNRITNTRELIRQAINRVRESFVPETITLETDITPEVTIYVDIAAYICGNGGYTIIEITGVEVLKDTTYRAISLVNIAHYIGDELNKAAQIFNHASSEGFKDWCYQVKSLEM